MFGSLGNLGSLLKQAQQIGGRLEGLNQELKAAAGRRARPAAAWSRSKSTG